MRKRARLSANQAAALAWLAQHPASTELEIARGAPGKSPVTSLMRRSFVMVKVLPGRTIRLDDGRLQGVKPTAVYSVTERGRRWLAEEVRER